MIASVTAGSVVAWTCTARRTYRRRLPARSAARRPTRPTSLFHHVGGLGNLAVALANGATLITFPAFPVEAWKEIGALEPTHAVTVP